MDEDQDLLRMLANLVEDDISQPGEPSKVIIPSKQDMIEVETVGPSNLDVQTEIIGKFRNISETILDRYAEDRGQIDKACKYFEDLVTSTNNPKTAWLEQWVSALRAKADTNASAVKILDSITKLFSAGKGTNIFIQNNNLNDSTDEELKRLLEE